MRNALLSIEKIREFFEVNGLSIFYYNKIEVKEVFAGMEFCTREEAYKALGTWTGLYHDLIDYCNQ